MRNIFSFVKRIVAGAQLPRDEGPTEAVPLTGILTITADLRFYSSILSAAYSYGWSAEWANSMNRGLEICGSRVIRIVIYDRSLPHVDWQYALDHLSSAASQARILLAAPEVDEDLWRTVLRRRGYDVLARSANPEQLKRELRFAWLSLQAPMPQEQRETVAPVLSGG